MPNLSDRVKDQIAWAMVIISPAMFSSNMIMSRGMAGVFPPISMAFSRWLFVGLLVFFALAIFSRANFRQVLKEYKSILFLGSLGMGLCGGPVYLAGELTTATNIGLIYSTAPLLIVLISFFSFKEPLGKGQAFGLVLGLFGVLVIMTKADLSQLIALNFNGGDLWIVLATISFSIYSLGLKYLKTSLTQIQRFAAMALGGALWHAPFVGLEVLTRGAWPPITMEILGALMVLIFISSIGAYLSYGYIVSQLGTTIAGATLYLPPVYAAVLAAIILDEQIMVYHILGGAMIFPGIWLVSRRKK